MLGWMQVLCCSAKQGLRGRVDEGVSDLACDFSELLQTSWPDETYQVPAK